jgi:hypothetical protein
MNAINFSELNWLAIAVAALATFMLGGAWYTALFGKAWQRAHGYSDEQLKQIQAVKPPPVFFGTMIACYFIIALAIALVAQLAGVSSAGSGATLGIVLWLIAAAIGLTNHIPTHTTMAGYAIDTAYQLIYLIGTGAIIGAWR